jgi:hypothetical protein
LQHGALAGVKVQGHRGHAHDDGGLALAVVHGIVTLALAHLAVAMAFVDGAGAGVAGAHLQPEPLALCRRDQWSSAPAAAGPALALGVGGDGDVEQMHLVQHLHGDEVAQQPIALTSSWAW